MTLTNRRDSTLRVTPARGSFVILSLVVLIAGILGLVRIQYRGVLESWDFTWFDRMATQEVTAEQVEPYVVILVDDESLVQLDERWPLSRETWARALSVIGATQPEVLALNVWFEKRVSLPALDWGEEFINQLDLLQSQQPSPMLENMLSAADERLQRLDANTALEQAVVLTGNVILGMACVNRIISGASIPGWMSGLENTSPELAKTALPCAEMSMSYTDLAVRAFANAGVNVRYEPDGVIRRYPMYFGYHGAVYPSMATAVLMSVNDQTYQRLSRSWLVEDGGMPLMRPFDPRQVPTLSLIDVLDVDDPQLLGQLLAGKRVFIGVSATGAGDTVNLPGHSRVPGVFVHVMAAINAERGGLLRAYAPALAWSVAFSILGLIGLAWIATRYSLLTTTVVGVTSCGLSLWGAKLALGAGVFITLIPWWIGVSGILLVVIANRVNAERRNRGEARRIRGAFQHYVAPEIIDELMKHRDKLRLGGERQDITAFFSDIVGFTHLAENLTPATLVKLLNEILSALSDVIIAEGGIIDKYVGDATVAMFGAPIAQPDHAERACRAALRCQARMSEIRADWQERGLPDVKVRIGLNSGVAVVGNIGSEARFDFTMLGDTVNLAARLEGVNNVYQTPILVGEQTRALAGDQLAFREIDRVRVKGKDRAVAIFEPLGLADQLSDEQRTRIDQYQRALSLYRERDFQEALAAFEQLAAAGDPPAHAMRARTAQYVQTSVPEDWDGTFDLMHK